MSFSRLNGNAALQTCEVNLPFSRFPFDPFCLVILQGDQKGILGRIMVKFVVGT